VRSGNERDWLRGNGTHEQSVCSLQQKVQRHAFTSTLPPEGPKALVQQPPSTTRPSTTARTATTTRPSPASWHALRCYAVLV